MGFGGRAELASTPAETGAFPMKFPPTIFRRSPRTEHAQHDCNENRQIERLIEVVISVLRFDETILFEKVLNAYYCKINLEDFNLCQAAWEQLKRARLPRPILKLILRSGLPLDGKYACAVRYPFSFSLATLFSPGALAGSFWCS